MKKFSLVVSVLVAFLLGSGVDGSAESQGPWNPLADTGQASCYDAAGNEIPCPAEGQALHGQDAQYEGAAQSFQDNSDGTVTDLNTTLMWQQTNDVTLRSWQAGTDYCTALTLGGHSDWRLPERLELQSIIDYGRVGELAMNPLFSYQSAFPYYWSANTYAGNSTFAWVIYFGSGDDSTQPKTDAYSVRCVRPSL